MPAAVGSPTQPIQLSDLQSILATMNVPAMSAAVAVQGGDGKQTTEMEIDGEEVVYILQIIYTCCGEKNKKWLCFSLF